MDTLTTLQIIGLVITFGSSIVGLFSTQSYDPNTRTLTKLGKVVFLISIIGLTTSVSTTVMERLKEIEIERISRQESENSTRKIEQNFEGVKQEANRTIKKNSEKITDGIKAVNGQAKKIKQNLTQIKDLINSDNTELNRLISETLELSGGIYSNTESLRAEFRTQIETVQNEVIDHLNGFANETKNLVSSSAESHAQQIRSLKEVIEDRTKDVGSLNDEVRSIKEVLSNLGPKIDRLETGVSKILNDSIK